jgi:NodT family efflux transporter outer membrane factor (OMF) lipoprotein
MPIPANYKEVGSWVATKSPVAIGNNPWWELFHDQTLNELEQKVTCSNENLKIALARYQEACAVAQVARSAYFPTVNGFGNAVRQQNSSNSAASSGITSLRNSAFVLGATLNYEIDAWGQIRNAVAASESLARASKYDLAAINLSMHAELANDYFMLRGDEVSQRVLDATVVVYEKALFLTRKRHDGGAAPAEDVDQAETQLESARTLATDMRLKRAQLEHAIAVLTGEIPANFKLAPARPKVKHVMLAPNLPSTLLEQRPDIAAAAERVRAANANIGVARAAFFPEFNLMTLIGLQSSQLSNLFSASSLFWSLGAPTTLAIIKPAVNQVIFDGFKLQGLLKQAKASYYEDVSIYRQTVLVAFQEVEDNLVAIRRLDQEIQTQTASAAAAYRALFHANKRYEGGISTFLDVVITQNQALQSELALILIRTRRQVASVQLIKALGGGWCAPNTCV